MSVKESWDLELPPKRDTAAVKSIRKQLAGLDHIKDAKIASPLYGAALVSFPPNKAFEIAVFTTDGSAYLVRFSDQHGWESVEEIELSEYWDQYTLSTVVDE